MSEAATHTARTIHLPDGTAIQGATPVVVIGPNGSGKSRGIRSLSTQAGSVEFVSTLRNTQLSPQVPMVTVGEGDNALNSSRSQMRDAHWQQVSDFDVMIAQMLAADTDSARKFRTAAKQNTGEEIPDTTLEKVKVLWSDVFPDRSFDLEGHQPTITSSATGDQQSYSGHTMSDGEKAALYLMGKVLSAQPGVMVIDEAETHLHSLLASELWDVLEASRPDIRFVYVTHDLTFGLSRREPHFVLADPKTGFRLLDLGENVATDIVPILLGSASFAFNARRLVLCEGEDTSLDSGLYKAWFNDKHTVVVSAGSCERVIRTVDAMKNEKLVTGLTVEGIIDRDFHPQAFFDALKQVSPLGLHEVESLYALPAVVQAMCAHLKRSFDQSAYIEGLRAGLDDTSRHRVILERWKRALEPHLGSLLSSIQTKDTDIATIVSTLPDIFDYSKWSFSPQQMLETERANVETAVPSGDFEDILRFMPGKTLVGPALTAVGLSKHDYFNLVNQALASSEKDFASLSKAIEVAMSPHLPPRKA